MRNLMARERGGFRGVVDTGTTPFWVASLDSSYILSRAGASRKWAGRPSFHWLHLPFESSVDHTEARNAKRRISLSVSVRRPLDQKHQAVERHGQVVFLVPPQWDALPNKTHLPL
jgi:hypothetical protein